MYKIVYLFTYFDRGSSDKLKRFFQNTSPLFQGFPHIFFRNSGQTFSISHLLVKFCANKYFNLMELLRSICTYMNEKKVKSGASLATPSPTQHTPVKNLKSQLLADFVLSIPMGADF